MRTLSIAQNTTGDDARSAMTRLAGLPAERRARVLSSVAQLNADPDKLLTGESPSPGALIVVSHERWFIERVIS
ncbi:hypothetical protein [Bifidobacterium sp. UBA4282]|uniref:hypothetical protein n=1 Tax=Bifidobacterium sp. UBA4282 TaxID=1946096 RepID=UPI0025BF5F19|nr:hypothetical protein [Bifidobacterium sp. UBA4282]